MIIGGHVDEATQLKIVRGEYVDFSKLIPRDHTLNEGDTRLELIVCNGRTLWAPMAEAVSINNFARWEQAFRIFSNVYTRYHPEKSSELIQYNHIINTISLTYTWENVYAYDKEFHMHMSKYPEHSWSIILQQAWSMKLRDCIQYNSSSSMSSWSNGNMSQNNRGQKSNSSPLTGKH